MWSNIKKCLKKGKIMSKSNHQFPAANPEIEKLAELFYSFFDMDINTTDGDEVALDGDEVAFVLANSLSKVFKLILSGKSISSKYLVFSLSFFMTEVREQLLVIGTSQEDIDLILRTVLNISLSERNKAFAADNAIKECINYDVY